MAMSILGVSMIVTIREKWHKLVKSFVEIQMEGGWMSNKVQHQSKFKHNSEHLFHVCCVRKCRRNSAGSIFQKLYLMNETYRV